jgi:hypothetical protein
VSAGRVGIEKTSLISLTSEERRARPHMPLILMPPCRRPKTVKPNADDCNIYVRSRRAGERVMASVSRFLTKKLRLTFEQIARCFRSTRYSSAVLQSRDRSCRRRL